MLRGWTERSVRDALDVVSQSFNDGRVLPGCGAVGIELARRLRDYADSVTGREQFAVEVVADALEVVPKILAENAGIDPIDALIALRTVHGGGDSSVGLDVFSKEARDMYEEGVVEPAHGKMQALDSTTEVGDARPQD